MKGNDQFVDLDALFEFLDLRVDLGDRVVDEGMSTVKISDDLEGGDFDPFGKFLGQSINPGGNGASE